MRSDHESITFGNTEWAELVATDKQQTDRIRDLEAALAKLDTTAKYLGDCNARNADKANRLEAALRQARPYVYSAEVADAADLEARYCILSAIDALLPQSETPAEQGCEHCGSIEVNPKCPACNGIERDA